MTTNRMTGPRRFLARFAADRSGATAIEYGLIITLLFLAIVTAVVTMGGNLGASMQETSDTIVGAGG